MQVELETKDVTESLIFTLKFTQTCFQVRCILLHKMSGYLYLRFKQTCFQVR